MLPQSVGTYAVRGIRSSRRLIGQIRYNATTTKTVQTTEVAYQLAVKTLKEQRERKLAQLQLLKKELDAITGQDDLSNGRRRNLQRDIFKLQVQAEKDQPETLDSIKSNQYDLTKPVFRYLRQHHWQGKPYSKLMERITQMYVLPDVLPPSIKPEIDVQLEFNGLTAGSFVHGDVVSTELTLQPPVIHAQCFHDATRLYTLLLVDPDDPFPEERTYRTRIHWLVMNIPLDIHTSTLNTDAGKTVLDYLPPHPAKGSKKHRYTLVLLEQSASSPLLAESNGTKKSPTSSDTALNTATTTTNQLPAMDGHLIENIANEFANRVIDVSEFAQQYQLVPRGLTFFRAEWESSTDTIYKEILGVKSPRYGRVPKLDPVRDAAIIARLTS